MDRRKKVSSLAAIVASTLFLIALASLASTTWATPAQNDDPNDTVPDIFCYDEFVARADSTYLHILVNHPATYTDTWYSTVLTDPIDSNLQVTGLGTTRGYGTWVGQDVTFTLGTILPGELVELNIYVRVRDDAPYGHEVTNTAYLKHLGWDTIPSTDPPCDEVPQWMFTVAYEQRMPLAMRRLR
jgi:hypothetical protein